MAKHLAAAGLEAQVKIIGPESSNADSHGLALVMACQNEPICWASLDAIASHSYSMAAIESWANATNSSTQPTAADGTMDAASTGRKGYWMTESGSFWTLNYPTLYPGNNGEWQGVAFASRFLNDLNHMVDTWVFFIGAWTQDKQMLGGKTNCASSGGSNCGALCGTTTCGTDRQEDMKLISTCPSLATDGKPCYTREGNTTPTYYELMPTYYYAQQLRQTFDLGCVLRYSLANTTRLPDMAWTYGVHPALHVAAGRNPDGSWAVGITNPTGIPTVEHLNGVPTRLFPNATTLVVKLVLSDLAGTSVPLPRGGQDLEFAVHRSTGNVAYNVEEESVLMRGGVVVVTVASNEMVTLRSVAPLSRL